MAHRDKQEHSRHGASLKAGHKRCVGWDRTGGLDAAGVSESSVTAVSPAAAIFRAIPPRLLAAPTSVDFQAWLGLKSLPRSGIAS